MLMPMGHVLPSPESGRLTASRAWRSLAPAVLLTLGLGACAGDQSKVTRPVEPVAESQDVASLVRLADGLHERGELTTAIALYQRAAASSEDARELVLLGRALQEAGANERAAGAFRRALSRDPENPDALLGLGVAYLSLGQIDKSIQYLQELVNPGKGSDTVRYAALGAALDIAGRHDQAVAIYTAGLEVVPDDLDLKSNLALSYAFYDRHVEAINLMIDVTDALEARRSHHRNLVLVLALAGQDRDAVATGLRLLGEKETQDVMAQAASVRQLSNGADRARAIGLS
ncbi:MAG: tetratricopeptide repeat protein [Alphaproteobacteria bacterium]